MSSARTNSFCPLSSTALAMPAASVDPSNAITNGMQNSSDTIVTKLYRFSGLIFAMSFLLKMALAENATLEAIAVLKPSHVKDSSVADASATPPMMGTSAMYTGHAYTVPETRYEPTALNTGSSVLMVCVKDTATAANETLVRQWPKACRKDGRVTALRNSESGFSNLTRRVVQKNVMMSKPTAR